MDIHASPASLPALDEFLATFPVRCRRPEGPAALARSRTGLLTALPNKHGDPMAQAVPGTQEPRWQECLTHLPWAEPDRHPQRVAQMIAEAPGGKGVLLFADTGCAPQGQASVGVARPYAGTLGQVGNCPGGVTCGASDPQARGPVAGRVDLPQAWTDAPERLRRARVPTDVPFQPQPQSALALVDQARAWGVPHRGVVAAADDGAPPHGWAGLETRHARSVVAVRSALQVRPQWGDAPHAQRVDPVWSTGPRRPWRPSRWRHGSQGGRRQQGVAVRAWRSTAEGDTRSGWWLGERAARAQPEDPTDYWSTLPAAASLEEVVDSAHRRPASEPWHEEAKEALGWDQYPGRWWSGLHRPAVTVMLAMSVLLWLALRQRQSHPNRGRPRDPVSPSAGSLASCAASGASGGSAVAAPPSGALVAIH